MKVSSIIPGESSVLLDWALRVEKPRWPPRFLRMSFLIPLCLSYLLTVFHWSRFRTFGMGELAMLELISLAAGTVFVGGVGFVSRSICHAISAEMRDLVRITGVNVVVLMWVITIVRWWTVGWSLLTLVPAAMFAYTLGGVTKAHFIGGACVLLLLFALSTSLGMLASVLNSDGRNPEKATPGLAGLLFVLYNLFFVVFSQIMYWGQRFVSRDILVWMDDMSTFLQQCCPALVIQPGLSSPDSFEPWKPNYWMHFVFSALIAIFASFLAVRRFNRNTEFVGESRRVGRLKIALKSTSTTTNLGTEESSRRSRIGTRCPDHPFFWSEINLRAKNSVLGILFYPFSVIWILAVRLWNSPFFWKETRFTTEDRHINVWSWLYLLATIGVFAALIRYENPGRTVSAVLTVISAIFIVCIVVIRFDALMMSEMRERTWGTLTLLPVDLEDLLVIKFLAVLWEHRFGLLPVSIVCISTSLNPTLIMVIAISFLMGGATTIFLSQLSFVNQMLGNRWWLGPVELFGVAIIATVSVVTWVISGPYVGFGLNSLAWLALVYGVQRGIVVPVYKDWSESS